MELPEDLNLDEGAAEEDQQDEDAQPGQCTAYSIFGEFTSYKSSV